LKLQYDEALSNFASNCNFNLHRYIEAAVAAVEETKKTAAEKAKAAEAGALAAERAKVVGRCNFKRIETRVATACSFERLMLNYDTPLSSVAVDFNLGRCSAAAKEAGENEIAAKAATSAASKNADAAASAAREVGRCRLTLVEIRVNSAAPGVSS